MTSPESPGFVPGRVHLRRLREVYRSAGWPSLDTVEVELLAAGLLERVVETGTPERVRLTDAGLRVLAGALARNKRALSAHDALVLRVAQMLQAQGRLVWTQLQLRAQVPAVEAQPAYWRLCRPDVFSVRHTTVAAYLQPVVHEIKVSRADLLGDLQQADKRASYLDVAGQCWYVLGNDARGRPIAEPGEVPEPCGVLQERAPGRFEVLRAAAPRAVPDLPFALWMALARAAPLPAPESAPEHLPPQAMLVPGDG